MRQPVEFVPPHILKKRKAKEANMQREARRLEMAAQVLMARSSLSYIWIAYHSPPAPWHKRGRRRWTRRWSLSLSADIRLNRPNSSCDRMYP